MIRSTGETTTVDPLIGRAPFSLLPQSFNPLKPTLLNSDLFNRLKLTALKSPEKLLKQANSIMDNSNKQAKADSMSTLDSDMNTDKSSSVNEVHVKQKRPTAMRKRATFCAKPILSDVVLESSIDIDKLEDPEEYFAACESMENARKEVDKQKPKALAELDQNLPVLSPRRRRPSIYGKPATYKHHSYAPIAMGDVVEKLLPSEEISQKRIPSVSRMDSLPETNVLNTTPQLRDSNPKSAISSLVHHSEETLSSNSDDELEALEILRDKMQFTFKDIGKVSLDGSFFNVQRPESGTTSQALPKITDSISVPNGLQDSIGSQSPVVINRLRENPNRSQLSQGQSRSPLASISSLKRHISKLTPPQDPFSTLDVDPLTLRGSSPEKQHANQSDYDYLNESAQSVVQDEESARVQMGNETIEPIDEAIQLDHDAACKETHENETDCERPYSHGEENVTFAGEDPLDFTARVEDPPREYEEIEEQVTTVPDTVHQDSNILDSTSENLNQKTVEECATGTGEALNLDDIVTEEPNKDTASDVPEGRESQAHTSKKTMKKGRKASALSNPPVVEETQNKKRKVECGKVELKRLSRRKSLFDAGTKWDGGVRRSTRIKMRPLEYWKGERFLYGRVTDSLVTVIGVKYASPSKEVKKPAAKVKSFVSDNYKELVDLASFH